MWSPRECKVLFVAGPTNHDADGLWKSRNLHSGWQDLPQPKTFELLFGRVSCIPVHTAQLNAPTPKGASLCESLISRLLRAQMGDL